MVSGKRSIVDLGASGVNISSPATVPASESESESVPVPDPDPDPDPDEVSRSPERGAENGSLIASGRECPP